jgi:7-cyano-7-deazaguanine synthase in queuosine biosynthesis
MTAANTHEVLVLLSGGIDSAACLDFYKELGRPPCALFVDYGHPAARLKLAPQSQLPPIIQSHSFP